MSLPSRLGFGLAFSLIVGLGAPMIAIAPSNRNSTSNRLAASFAQTQTAQAPARSFSDVSRDHWAHDYIEGLAKFDIISGFPNGTFRPNDSVTRAQFAAILRQAFLQSQPTTVQPFTDVSADYWATDAIYAARSAGFLSGYPDNRFAPNDLITREDALISLASGLNYADGSEDALFAYLDTSNVSDYAIPGVRAAAQAGLIVSYPNLDRIVPSRPAGRSEVAAFVYQALVDSGKAEPLAAKDRWQIAPAVTLLAQSARMSLSQTGQRLATMTFEGKSFQIWDIQTGDLIEEITAPENFRFDNVAIARGGERVAAIAENLLTHEMTLSAWTATGESLWQKPLDIPQNQLRDRRLFNEPIVQVAFTPSDREIVTQLMLDPYADDPANNRLRFQNAATGEATQSLDFSTTTGAQLQRIAFSPDGQFFASAQTATFSGVENMSVNLWQRDENNRLESFRSLPTTGPLPNDGSRLLDMVFVDNETLNISSRLGQWPQVSASLDSWQVQTGKRLSRRATSWDRTDFFTELSPDGNYYFVRGDVAGSRLINVRTGERQSPRAESSINSATFSGDSNYLAIATNHDISIFTKVTPTP